MCAIVTATGLCPRRLNVEIKSLKIVPPKSGVFVIGIVASRVSAAVFAWSGRRAMQVLRMLKAH
jgi:hypothetical protein